MTRFRTNRRRSWTCFIGMMLLGVTATARADESSSPWQTDLETAKQLAHSSRRLVLVHFWAPWCSACTKMENDVYAQPGYHQALSGMYVPVKLNADSNHELVQQLGVSALPTDVVILPSGQVVDRVQGAQDPRTHMARMTEIARRVNPTAQPGAIAQAGVAPAPQMPPMNPDPAAQPNGGVVAPWNAAPAQPPVANNAAPGVAAAGMVAMGAAAPSALPGLDGYCPVDLCERHVWTAGNRQFGANHRGRVYLFSSAEAQQKFMANPDRYAPVAGGDDPVVAMHQQQMVPGRREFGMFYQGRVFLFAGAQSRDAFRADPNRYVAEAQQVRR
jgi:protein disulfide-isomerase